MSSFLRWVPWISGGIYLAVAVAWFANFPLKDSFNHVDLASEGALLLAVALAYPFILRLRIPLLVIGWPLFSLGLFIDVLDEFTLDKEFLNDLFEDLFVAFGLILVAFGFYFSFRKNVREQSKAEESAQRLAEEKQRLLVTLGSIGEGVVATDLLGRIDAINAVACRDAGVAWEEAVGRPIGEIFDLQGSKDAPTVVDLLEQARSGPTPWRDYCLRRDSGETRTLEISANPIQLEESEPTGAVLILRDVTERREREKELLHVSKLESLGLLAGGVAHDFNNILTGVLNWASLAKDRTASRLEGVDPWQKIREACKRGKALSTQLMGLAKGGQPIRAPRALPDLVRGEMEFALHGSSLTCGCSFPEDVWTVNIDEGQISQVIQNLALNAKQAMPHGGAVQVSLANVVIADQDHRPLEPGHYVRMSVQDGGPGIHPRDLESIFDPYFTTKRSGFGLGLATSFAIVRRHGGHISVKSEGDVGTTFHVYLPATEEAAARSQGAIDGISGGSESVLVVDDDSDLRDPLVIALQQDGFRVAAAGDGRAAVDRYRRALDDGHRFDVVLMDLTMPGEINGRVAMQEILALDASAVAIVASGYHDDPVMANFREHGFHGVLPKPFEPEEVSRKIRETLDTTQAAGAARPDGDRS